MFVKKDRREEDVCVEGQKRGRCLYRRTERDVCRTEEDVCAERQRGEDVCVEGQERARCLCRRTEGGRRLCRTVEGGRGLCRRAGRKVVCIEGHCLRQRGKGFVYKGRGRRGFYCRSWGRDVLVEGVVKGGGGVVVGGWMMLLLLKGCRGKIPFCRKWWYLCAKGKRGTFCVRSLRTRGERAGELVGSGR